MKENIYSIYFLKTSVYKTEEEAWEAFTKWIGYDKQLRYCIIMNKQWWDVYQIF